MIFSNNYNTSQLSVQLKGEVINQAHHANWKQQITEIISKASKALSLIKAMSTIARGAHASILLKIYMGLVRTILEWVKLCYINATKSDLCKLDTIQNKAIRIYTGLTKNTHTFA